MLVFKKVRMLKDGNYYPLFIDKRRKFEFNEWMHSEFHPTSGFAERSIGKGGDGEELGGWHCTPAPKADWIADELKSGEKRVWMLCDTKNVVEYQRPQGTWYLAEWLMPIRILTDEEVAEYNS